MRFPRDFAALCLRVLATWIERPDRDVPRFAATALPPPVENAVDLPTTTPPELTARPVVVFQVWRVNERSRWTLDRRGASRDPGRALARALLWEALGVGACVVPSDCDPNDAATVPHGFDPWAQVGRSFVVGGVVS